MGEYATYNGHSIKIGTCEDMYYLRAGQAPMVRHERGNVDPSSPKDQRVIRFRFPWPDEDGTAPGAFENYDRAVGVWNIAPPAAIEHRTVQFVSDRGYNVCLPCPEGPAANHGLKVHRNGFAGPVRIVQQAYRGGVLALICECGGCGARYNLPTLADAEPVIVACRAEADAAARRDGDDSSQARWWHRVADRIAVGYSERSEG
jgi:hypothetical protein